MPIRCSESYITPPAGLAPLRRCRSPLRSRGLNIPEPTQVVRVDLQNSSPPSPAAPSPTRLHPHPAEPLPATDRPMCDRRQRLPVHPAALPVASPPPPRDTSHLSPTCLPITSEVMSELSDLSLTTRASPPSAAFLEVMAECRAVSPYRNRHPHPAPPQPPPPETLDALHRRELIHDLAMFKERVAQLEEERMLTIEAHRGQLQALRDRERELLHELEALRAKPDGTDEQRRCSELEQKLRTLQEQFDEAKAAKEAAESARAAAEKEVKALRERLKDAEGQLRNLNDTLEAEKDSLGQSLRDIQGDRDTLNDRLSSLSRENAALRGEMNKLRDMLKSKDAEVKRLQEELAESAASEDELNNTKAELKRLRGVEEELERMREEWEKLRQERDGDMRGHQDTQERILQLERIARDAERWRLEADRLQKRLEGLPISLEEYLAEKEMEKRRWEEMQARHEDELRRSDFIHARQCNDLVANIEEARQQRDQKIRELADMEVENERLHHELSTLRREVAASAGLQQEKNYALDDLRSVQGQVERLKRENNELRMKLERAAVNDRTRDGEMKQAFADLRKAYDETLARNEVYRKQLHDATVDYKHLEGVLDRMERENNALQQNSMMVSTRRTDKTRQVHQQLADVHSHIRAIIPAVGGANRAGLETVCNKVQSAMSQLSSKY